MYPSVLIVILASAVVLKINGLEEEDKITGGHNALIGEYPFIVQMIHNDRFYCGGSIRDRNVIITAAHCVLDRNVSSYGIRVGTSRRNEGGKLYRVAKIISHPLYNYPTEFDYDIALIKLRSPLTYYSDKVWPIKLATKRDLRYTRPPYRGIVLGWGQIWHDGPFSDDLKVVTVPLRHPKTCMEADPEDFDPRTMFCAGLIRGTKDSCPGDSGGPFIVNRTLVGVVSFGYKCGLPGHAGVYTSLPSFVKFINQRV